MTLCKNQLHVPRSKQPAFRYTGDRVKFMVPTDVGEEALMLGRPARRLHEWIRGVIDDLVRFDDDGERAENGGIVEIASDIKTFGVAAMFKNVYYHVGEQRIGEIGKVAVTHLSQLGALHAIIILIHQVRFLSHGAKPCAL
jgi:hypothetical protein